MNFDAAKENIQPLRQGRRADRLELVLDEQNKESLEMECLQHLEAIKSYEGQDPLGPWYDYICWIEQSYPKNGAEGRLDETVVKCIMEFESVAKYKQDRRMIKLYIKYIDTQKDPQESYGQLYINGIGTLVADLYIAWSHYYDIANNFKQVEAIFRKGFDAGAQPFEDLNHAYQAFVSSISQRFLADDEKQFQATMEEKRSALTSLRTHKKKFVGSSRTGIAVRDVNPGVVNQEGLSPAGSSKIAVHEDPAAAALPTQGSVIKSIIDSSRQRENALEPGPWSNAKSGKPGTLFGKASANLQPGFVIMEDENLPPIPYTERLYELGIQLPKDFVTCNGPQTPWNIQTVIEEPIVAGAIPCYEKILLYPNATTEISPEEYRGYKWFQSRGISAPVTQQYDRIWTNSFETGARIPPGFPARNIKQVEKVNFERFIREDGNYNVPLGTMYPEDGEELSFEELRAEKFKRGLIKILTESDFIEISMGDEMDITLISDRRQSIYPASRKSIIPRRSVMPRKSVMPHLLPEVNEDAESSMSEESAKLEEVKTTKLEELKPTGAIRKSIVKRRFEDCTNELAEDVGATKRGYTAETPPRTSFSIFKQPAPVEKKSIRAFEIDDDEAGGFAANDTCSTQQFNLFIKAQSVSTPLSKKSVPKLVPIGTEKENLTPPKVGCEDAASPENIDPFLTTADATPSPPAEGLLANKLSTIMETTEQSHKSSVSHASAQNETDVQAKTTKVLQNSHQIQLLESVNPLLLGSFRLPEDQTESCPIMQLRPIRVKEINSTPAKMMSMRIPEIAHRAPAFESFVDKSLSPTPKSDYSDSIHVPKPEDSLISIPETQADAGNLYSLMIPATQQESLNEVLGAGEDEDFEIPATQEPSQTTEIVAKSMTEAAAKNISGSFKIYEDSVKEASAPKTSAVFKTSDGDGTGFLHMSRKENLIVQPPASAVKRTVSDEFFDMLDSPRTSKSTATGNLQKTQQDVSDLLKFSHRSSSEIAGLLEAKMNKLTIEAPKSATPTLFVDDLNTEKFAFGNLKNSTLLADATNELNPRKPSTDDLSFIIGDDELQRLGWQGKVPEDKEVPTEPEFKLPELPLLKAPAAPPKASSPFAIFEDGSEEEEEDLCKSIYHAKPEPELEPEDSEGWDRERMCSFISSATNKYEHTIHDDDHDFSLKVEEAIKNSNGNPFDENVREAMLNHCNFSIYLEDQVSSCTLLKNIPKLKQGAAVECGGEEFKVIKLIAKGGFGSIFTARNSASGEVVAMKQEKPANLWEYYIGVELMDRLKDKRMIPGFMNIERAIIAQNASILVTQFSPYGTIIDVCNKFKIATNKNVDEYVVMVLTSQILSIIDHLHGCKIIHADVKPDNFLLMRKIEFGTVVPAIQLIDFGCAIDMDWYHSNDKFTRVVETVNFTCCEMMEGKPWTYQTDLFGLAGTSHVMLFGKYMEVEKRLLSWSIKSKFPRYFNKTLWGHFFNVLLNVPSCDAMPNLQDLKDQFQEEIHFKEKYIVDKISEFNTVLNLKSS